MKQIIVTAWGVAGRRASLRFAGGGRGDSQRVAYWRPGRGRIAAAERMPGGQVRIFDAGGRWWSATRTVADQFARADLTR